MSAAIAEQEQRIREVNDRLLKNEEPLFSIMASKILAKDKELKQADGKPRKFKKIVPDIVKEVLADRNKASITYVVFGGHRHQSERMIVLSSYIISTAVKNSGHPENTTLQGLIDPVTELGEVNNLSHLFSAGVAVLNGVVKHIASQTARPVSSPERK